MLGASEGDGESLAIGPDLLVVLSGGGRFDRDRLTGHRVEPRERRVGDFAPAAVDREGVSTAFELA